MAMRLQNALDAPSAPNGSDEPDALQRLVRRVEAMATEGLSGLERRGLSYLNAGYPLHLRGSAGSGKTTLALRIAEQLKRPVLLLVGDASFDTRRLVCGEEVTRTNRVVDRYISSVMKVENQTNIVWLDRALTVACTEGGTLVYDEFNRAPAHANNALLTVLEERLLVLLMLLTVRIRLVVASVDRALEMGIRWWENDSAMNGNRVPQADTAALLERVARLEHALAAASGTLV